MSTMLRTAAFLVVLVIGAGHRVAGADAGPETCYIVADSNAQAVDGDAQDLLTRVNRSDPDPATNETNIGTGTGTFNIEAIAMQPGTGVLFATDAGVLGTLDTTSGRFHAIGAVGTGSGPLGAVKLDDIDGLSFDATTGILFGTHRRTGGEDLLLVIDPATGAVVDNGVAGAAYVAVPAISGLPDIDDLAVDPLDGQMYGVANDDGRRDRLVRIDKATGATTDVGAMGASDMEGLSFAAGQLIGTTGKNQREEGIWDIDKATGAASNMRPLDNARDYEGFACLNIPNPVSAPSPSPPAAPPAAPPAPAAPPPPVQQAEPEAPVRASAGAASPAPAPPVPPTVAASPAPEPAAELPRTGRATFQTLVPLGLGLALGGLGVIGGSRRRRRVRTREEHRDRIRRRRHGWDS